MTNQSQARVVSESRKWRVVKKPLISGVNKRTVK